MSSFEPKGPAGPPLFPPAPPLQPPPAGAGIGYPQPVAYPGIPNPSTNGLAIASLICAFLCSPLGLIFGIVARSQIKRTREQGSGLAVAGIIISALSLLTLVLFFVLAAAVGFRSGGTRIVFPTLTP